MSATPTTVIGGQGPSAASPAARAMPRTPPPAESKLVLAVRFVLTAAILAAYYRWYEPLRQALESLLHPEPSSPTVPMLLVTGLGVLLIAVWWKLVKTDPRFHAPILITYILAAGNATFGILENHHSDWLAQLTGGQIKEYSPTFVAILAAVVAEVLLGRFTLGKWPHLASAYISGISVGILIKSPELWPFVLCALLSITSKYALRFRGRHLWNPSNLGVSALLFLAPMTVASLSVQWSNTLWPMVIVWCLGALILYRVDRLHVSVTYAICFILFALVRSAVSGNDWLTEVAPITGPMYQLYICFMITDPRTTVRRRWLQCVVVMLVAAVEMAFRMQGAKWSVHSPYFALFLVGPIALVLEMLWDGQKKEAPRRLAPVAAAVPG